MIEIIKVTLWVCTLAVGVVTAAIYYKQLRNMHLTTLVTYLESPAVRAARAVVMEKRSYIESLDSDIDNSWQPDIRRPVAEVCASFDVAGNLASSGKIDPEFLVDHWGHSARRMKDILSTYIKALQSREGDGYLSGFMWLANEAKKNRY